MNSLNKIIAASRWNPPHDPDVSLAGKTVLVTGSNTGLGLEAAKKYAALGAKKIILGVRSIEKGQAAKIEIAKHAKYDTTIEVSLIDMSEFASVRAFAERIHTDLQDEALDVALLNAGVTFMTPQVSPEGWEIHFQVNTLSTLLLAILLLPKLHASKTDTWTPVLTFNSSGTHKGVPISRFEKPQAAPTNETPFLTYWSQPGNFPGGQSIYAMSKLLVEFGVQQLADNYLVKDLATNQINIIVNSCCPGICQSDLGRDYTKNSITMKIVAGLIQSIVARTAEVGSRTLVSATVNGEESHGMFWQNDRFVVQVTSDNDDRGIMSSPERDALGQQVWKEMITVLQKAAPEIEGILKTEAG